MEKKFEKVKEFFEKENYLLNRVNIEVRKAIITEFFPSVQGMRILDMGCGDGSLSLPFIPKNKVVLLDAASQMIEHVRRNVMGAENSDHATVVQGDILQYQDDLKFDIILCIGVISHIEDPQALLKNIRSLLKPQGKALIQFSNIDHFRYRRRNQQAEINASGYALNTFNFKKFFQLTDQAGLRFKDKKGYFWQFPIMDRLSSSFQISILNSLRNKSIFYFLNSEWLVLFEKK